MSPPQSRLLIVDDNEMNRDMLARRLSRSGYLVDVAENARQLIQHVKENGLDLVLLDIEMPEVSGFDALKMLRKDYSPSQLPIIMVTARNQRADIVDLKSGTRLSGVTSDVSLDGCFVRTRESLEIGARVRLTLKHKNQNVLMLAIVRVLKPKIGMGLQALEVDSVSNETFLQWLDV